MTDLAVLDTQLCEELSTCIEELTTSQEDKQESVLLKRIKAICKKSDKYVEHSYHLLMFQLSKQNSQIRLAALSICDEIFQRSHQFRELLVNDFQDFLELVVGYEEELPSPRSYAVKLKRKALECIRQWFTKFGEGYKKLSLGYHFLKDCKNINFDDLHERELSTRVNEQEVQRRQQIVNNDKLKKMQLEMNDVLPEIKSCVEQMRNCIKLLSTSKIFNETDFEDPQPCCSKSLGQEPIRADEMESLIKEHGLGNTNYNLTVKVTVEEQSVAVTDDNSDIISNLKELQKLASTRYLPIIINWMKVAVKCSSSSEELKVAIDSKRTIDETLLRIKELNIDNTTNDSSCSSSDDDDDFIEVPSQATTSKSVSFVHRKSSNVNQTKVTTKQHKETVKNWKVFNAQESEIRDPTSFKCNASRMEMVARKKGLIKASSQGDNEQLSKADVDPVKRELLAKAPKIRVVELGGVQFDAAASTLKQDMGHRFWTSVTEKKEIKNESVRLGRVIEVGFNSDSVKWSCRAPLPNGTLCPRQDRYKCPFHGKIIARNAVGEPSNINDKRKLDSEKEKQQQENPDWQDPALLRELQAVTGIDLTVKKKGKKDKKTAKKAKKLAAIAEPKPTARSRLEKKVFNKASVKRVARVMDSQDHKKFQDKFGSQFNYAFVE